MRPLLPILLLGLLAAPAFATPVAILRWDACDDGSAIVRNKDYVAGPVSQVVSARGLSGTVRGISFEIEVRGSVGFGDAWRFDSNGCNAGAVSYSIAAIGKSCPAVNSGQLVIQTYHWDSARGTARVRLGSVLTGSVVLDSTRTYVLGRVVYDHTNSVPGAGGAATCGGAELPMCFELLSATYLDEGGVEHPIEPGNATLTWQDAAQAADCSAASARGVRIGELFATCPPSDTTSQYVELTSTGEFDRRSADLRLRIEDHLGAVRFDAANLFSATAEGQPWPKGRTWLLGTNGFGAAADARMPAALDPEGGTVTLYEGNSILQELTYGPTAAGSSLSRLPDGTYAQGTPSPENAAGTAIPFACAAGNERVVIREFGLRCLDGGSSARFIELEAPSDQAFLGTMRLLVRDRNGALLMEAANLFQSEGAIWPAGRHWLLGAPTLTSTVGVSPDRNLPFASDAESGTIELYGGTGGAVLIDRIDYGPGRDVAAPPTGHSVLRLANGTLAIEALPTPTNFAGSTGSGACFCNGSACFDSSLVDVRMDEVAVACANGETSTQYVELRSIGVLQLFLGSLHLRAFDHAGVILFDQAALFPGQAEGASWPEGVAWLIALSRRTGTEIADAFGVTPDASIMEGLDPAGGRIELYDGRPGGQLIHVISYQALTPGSSIRRGPNDEIVFSPTQKPENHAGVHGSLLQCPCPSSGLATAEHALAWFTEPAHTVSDVKSSASYDKPAGTISAHVSDGFYSEAAANVTDLYVLHGPVTGQEVTIRATMHVVGGIIRNCGGPYGYLCSYAGGYAELEWNGSEEERTLDDDVDEMLTLPLTVRVGEPWRLEWNLSAYVSSEFPPGSANYDGRVEFLDVPAGMAITSCSGFRFDAPTAALPSIVSAGCADGVVHLEWSIDPPLTGAIVERTASDVWQALGAPEIVGDRLARYDDRSAAPGTRYGYRLRWSEGATEIAWVDVQAALALRALSANPSAGAPTLEFTLPKPARVRIEVLDLRGRRVESRDLGMQEAGVHRLEPGASLRPGVYWARLIVEGGEKRLKLIVL